jgi:hypothetical protein
MTQLILPDSRQTSPTGLVQTSQGWMQPIFCASCGTSGGLVPEESTTFAFWLCNSCYARHGELTNLMVMPDEVFWEEVKQAQQDKYHRIPSATEVVNALSDPESLESLLARDRANLTPAPSK